jgi:hypothetical protein
MLMFQVSDLGAARERARGLSVRQVFEVSIPEIEEVHLHPADMRSRSAGYGSRSRPRRRSDE